MQQSVKLYTCRLSAGWVQANPEGLHFTTSTDLGNTNKVFMPLEILSVGGAEMFRLLGSQGVTVNSAGRMYIQEHLMNWLANLRKAQKSQISLPFGWWTDNGKRRGFVYGGVLYKDDGTMVPAGWGDPTLREIYEPKGTAQPWIDAAKMITDQKRPELDAILATAFAGPLMVVPAEYTTLLAPYGVGGEGKSSTVKVSQSVWAHPKKAKEINMTTSRSSIAKLGELKNLPLYYDDVKDEKGQQAVLDVIFGTEGIGPGRLTSDIRQRSRPDWQTMLVMCSNVSFLDHVAKVHKSTSAGVYRTFEYVVHAPVAGAPGRLNTIDASRITQELEENYGVIGALYAKMLGSNPGAVDQWTLGICKQFGLSVKATQQERFWVALCGTLIAGASYANQLGAQIDIPALNAFLRVQFQKQRDRLGVENVEGGSVTNTETALTAFLKNYTANAIYTDVVPMGQGRPPAVTVLSGPKMDNPKPIYVQWAVATRVLRVDKTIFAQFLNDTKRHITPVLNGLKAHFGAKVVYASLGAGTPYRAGQENLIHIPVPAGSPLEPLMTVHSQPAPGSTPPPATTPVP